MAPKLLPFITIAVSLCQSISAIPFLNPAPVGHGAEAYASALERLHIVDFKHPDILTKAGRPPPGSAELPKAYPLPPHPSEVFPKHQGLQDLASQQAVWIHTNSFRPLSIDTKAEWSRHAEVYQKLKPGEKKKLQTWLESNLVKDSAPRAMAARRINWSLSQRDKDIWWDATLVKNANLKENEDIDLATIGNILHFQNRDPALKFDQRQAHRMIELLYPVFFKTSQDTTRTNSLKLGLLKPVGDSKGDSLYQARVAAMTASLWPTIPIQSGKDGTELQKKTLEVLYAAYGDSPKKAQRSASMALENMKQNPSLWAQLPSSGLYAEFERSLKTLSTTPRGSS
ncbi:hypothetical protein VP01_415g3 [Puccinia sorghi]|uniref:Uncharacterized protein n=1 Tax=Puccinia sorghi TaxID=27349 RepID=A0A0L6USX7_9BASI|nr:hypothetical protein VP01_415g3 [Puccinia sorghi]